MKFRGLSRVLVLVEGALSCMELAVGVVALLGALFWCEVEAEGATRVEEESLIAMLCRRWMGSVVQ